MLTVKEFIASADKSNPLENYTSDAIEEFDRLKLRLEIKVKDIQKKANRVLETIQKHDDADIKDFVLNTCGEFQEVPSTEMLLAELMQQRETVMGLLGAVERARQK